MTLIAHNAFLAYIALGARRSVREAARQSNLKARSSGDSNTRVKNNGEPVARLVGSAQVGEPGKRTGCVAGSCLG